MAASKGPDEVRLQDIAAELESYQPRRTQRYAAVTALLLSWEDDDLGCEEETKELERVFKRILLYTVLRYRIPSRNSQKALNSYVADFIYRFADKDNLIIVYYGGHGASAPSFGDQCTWAALTEGGSTLDWSLIQPQLFGAGCDVAILLDCCYAGLAASPHTSQNVEFLSATDKDQRAPLGQQWPSFTKVLARELAAMVKEQQIATLPQLQRRMLERRTGLYRQPFYVALSENSAGAIKFCRTHQSSPATHQSRNGGSYPSLDVRLSLPNGLDSDSTASLVRWMTRDAPSDIAEIRIASQVLEDAEQANILSVELMRSPLGVGDDLPPCLGNEGKNEAKRLLEALEETLSRPSPSYLSDPEALRIIEEIRKRSHDLAIFVSDSLSRLDRAFLEDIRSRNLGGTQDLRTRISLRLTLLADDVRANNTSVEFDNLDGQSRSGQSLRRGMKDNIPVLVEYYYPHAMNIRNQTDVLKQVHRIAALHSEPKGPEFRTLPGLGFVYEPLTPPRFGFIYQLPGNRVSHSYCRLSDLFLQVKRVPLDVRTKMAAALCEALLCLHSIGWYHKSIQSDNVLVFGVHANIELQSGGYSSADWDFDNPYLVGFDCSRPFEAETVGAVSFVTKNNMYHHPERWGGFTRFERYHDLYSLGVVLAEIACWTPLSRMDSKRSNFDHIKSPEGFRRFLLRLADERVSRAAGTRYAKGVSLALKSEEWKHYEGWEFQRQVREYVLRPLTELSIVTSSNC